MAGITSVASVGASVGAGGQIAAIQKRIAYLEKQLEGVLKDKKMAEKQRNQLAQMIMMQIMQLQAELAKLNASRAAKEVDNGAALSRQSEAESGASASPPQGATPDAALSGTNGGGVDTYV